MNTYFPLHVHSHFSLLDGLNKPQQIAKRCIENKLLGSALTDHGNVAGAITFSEAMNECKLKWIIGVEFYVAQEEPTKKQERSLTHLIILAKNLQGWKQLIKLTSEANKPEHFYYKPRLDLKSIANFADGNLIAFSGHLGSDLAKCIFTDITGVHIARTQQEIEQCLNSTYLEDACAKALEFQKIFGKDNFFIETQLIDKENIPANKVLTKILRDVSEKTNIPCIATPDAHYASRQDAIDQRILLCTNLDTTMQEIQKKIVNNEDIALGTFFKSNNYHIPTTEEMLSVGHTEEELANTLRISDMCETYQLTTRPRLPKFDCPNQLSSAQHLKQLCRTGWKNRWPKIQEIINSTLHTKEEYIDRFNMEFDTLEEVGLSDYFLIVHDIVNYALNDGQLVGAGRGSASGSLVLYLLNVTQIDPIEHDLLFSRFYNKGRNTADRISLPDVDMDFEIQKRGDIISYIKQRFGYDYVAQMLTFTRMQGRSALKDVLRAWSACSFDEMNQITSFIPDEAEISDQLQLMREADKEAGGDGEASIIQWALENHSKELKQWAYLDENNNIQGPLSKRFEQAIRIEGTKRSQGKHAAGVVISSEPLHKVCPMVHDKSNDEVIAGLEMNDLEAIGCVKFDILGVAYLDKVHSVVNMLWEGNN